MAQISDDLATQITNAFRVAQQDISNQDALLQSVGDVEVMLGGGVRKTVPSWDKMSKVAVNDLYNQEALLKNTGDVVVQFADGSAKTVASWDKMMNATVGTVPISRGGTGATSQSEARSSLGLGSAATSNVYGGGDVVGMTLFSSNFEGVRGWQILPSGFIIQFGQQSVGNGIYYSPFPRPFPTIAAAVSITIYGDVDLSAASIWKMTSEDVKTSLKMGVSGLNAIADVSWIAVGY